MVCAFVSKTATMYNNPQGDRRIFWLSEKLRNLNVEFTSLNIYSTGSRILLIFAFHACLASVTCAPLNGAMACPTVWYAGSLYTKYISLLGPQHDIMVSSFHRSKYMDDDSICSKDKMVLQTVYQLPAVEYDVLIMARTGNFFQSLINYSGNWIKGAALVCKCSRKTDQCLQSELFWVKAEQMFLAVPDQSRGEASHVRHPARLPTKFHLDVDLDGMDMPGDTTACREQ
jgi:hypothetical protein